MGTEKNSCEQGNGTLDLKTAENLLNKEFVSRSYVKQSRFLDI
jgi:hypothetical protein